MTVAEETEDSPQTAPDEPPESGAGTETDSAESAVPPDDGPAASERSSRPSDGARTRNADAAKPGPVTAEEPHADDADDEEDRARDADYLSDYWRWREFLARRSAVALGEGASAVNNIAEIGTLVENLTVGGGTRQISVVKSLLTRERVADREKRYVEVAGFDAMISTLGHECVVVLIGAPGDARWTTAMCLVARVCGTDRVGHLNIAEGSDLSSALAEQEEILSPDVGYIAELGSQPVGRGLLQALAEHAKRRTSFLVLLADHGASADELDPFAFEHHRPPLDRVLEVQLRGMLEEHPGGCKAAKKCTATDVDDYITRVTSHPLVTRQLGPLDPVRDVVGLAAVLAEHIDSGEEIPALIDRWNTRVLELAREILRSPEDPAQDRLEPHRQAFRISYALFDGHPLDDVFVASNLLTRDILPKHEQRETAPAYLVFDSILKELVHPAMAPAAAVEPVSPLTPRRAVLLEPRLSSALLEVAWHEYEALRTPLLGWLSALAGNDRVRIHLRAAQIAGTLAGFDFDTVYRELIRMWAHAGVQYRQAAAYALGSAYESGAQRRALQQVGDWSRSSTWQLQDTAARTYGTPLGTADPDAAAEALTVLSERRELAQSNAIPIALGSLWLFGATETIMRALCAWSGRHAQPMYLAARTLLLIADQPGSGERPGWPRVSELIADNPEQQAAFVDLWRYALTSVQLTGRSWEPLRRWLMSADGPEADSDLTTHVAGIVARIREPAAVDLRFRFNLQLWTRRHPRSGILSKI